MYIVLRLYVIHAILLLERGYKNNNKTRDDN